MEKTEKKKQSRKREPLLVDTLKNGYSVAFEGEKYMYFDILDLLEGLFVHVGMNRCGAMTKEHIKAMVEAVKDGSLVKRLQGEVNELKDVIKGLQKEIRALKKKNKELSEN